MAAWGNMGMAKRMNPYPPSFSSTPARITEPAVGACTCASGSHVCSGKSGTLMAKATAKAMKSQHWTLKGINEAAWPIRTGLNPPALLAR